MNRAGVSASIYTLGFAAVLSGCLDSPSGSSELRIVQVERTPAGQPYFVRGDLGQAVGDVARSPQALDAVLPAIAETLAIPSSDLRVSRVEQDQLGMTHVRLAQQKNGLRVVSGEANLHLDTDGTVRSVDSGVIDRDLPAVAAVAADDAARLAVEATPGQVGAHGSELVYVISNRDGEMYLAWEVAVKGNDGLPVSDLVYVDALDGRVVDRHPRIFTAKSRTIRNGAGGVFPVANAALLGSEGTPPTDPVALAAYTNTGVTYDCYKTLYNRDSYDGLGAVLTSQVHVVFDVGDGTTSPDNAVWADDVKMMAYGDGDGQLMKQLAYALDVTAHELTHAVTSSTANLVYQNESGALNEGMSDIMGARCEAWNAKAVSTKTWQIGEEIWTPATPNDALRYMDNPTLDKQSSDNYATRYTGTQDNGGVHLNSGIANLAFYLATAGGKHPRITTTTAVPALGIDRASAIFLRALTTKWTANTNFAAARTGAEQAAQELYPNTCAKTAVSLAWAAVGVGAAVPADATPPTVAIMSPATGAKVAAGFQVNVTTADDQCIHKVELLVDGAVAQTLDAPPYTFTTNAALASGSHTVEVKSYDAFNSTSATATVTISGNGGGNGPGNGGGDGDGSDDENSDVTGGCQAGGSGAGLLLGLALVGLAARRRR